MIAQASAGGFRIEHRHPEEARHVPGAGARTQACLLDEPAREADYGGARPGRYRPHLRLI
jgi:hypothetical protein